MQDADQVHHDEPIAVTLARYVVAAHSPFPAALAERARLGVLDTIGCMIGATATRPGKLISSVVASRAGAGTTTALGVAAPVRAEDSALVNATLAHMIEFDDGHRPSDNHLGCVVIPAALAMGEETGASFAECLDAIVVGYDAMGRAGEATLLPRRLSPFHGTGTTGVFGAAAVAARLLHLTEEETAHALAIAGTAAAGLRESTNTGPDCKPLHAGRGAQNGVSAAYLAASGYHGPLTIFEGVHGFCAAMCERPRPELVVDGLGERFALLESGFKVHSTCGMLFNVLDAVLATRTRFGLQDAPPLKVTVGVPVWLTREPAFARRRPETGGQARFSIPYAVAAAMIDGEVTPRQMTDARLRSADVRQMEERVVVTVDDEVEQVFQQTRDDPFFFYPGSIEVEVGGQTHRTVRFSPRGYDPTSPLTPDEVVRKFVSTVVGTVGLDETEAGAFADLVLTCPADQPVSGVMAPVAALLSGLAGAVLG